MDSQTMYEMYRLMAIAKYEERYVIPKAHVEQAHDLEEMGCSLDFEGGPGMHESGPFGEASGRPVPVAVETFNALQRAADLRRGASATPPARPGEPAELGRQRRTAAGCSRKRAACRRPSGAGTRGGGAAMSRRERWSSRLRPGVCPTRTGPARQGAADAAALAEFPGAGRVDFAEVMERLAARPPRELQSFYVRGVRPPASTPCTCPTGRTATPGAAATSWPNSSRSTGRAGSWWTPHGELPDYLPMVLEFAAPSTSTRPRPAARFRAEPGDDPLGAAPATGCRTPASCRPSAPPCREIPGRRAGRHADGRRRSAHRSRGPGPVDPRRWLTMLATDRRIRRSPWTSCLGRPALPWSWC